MTLPLQGMRLWVTRPGVASNRSAELWAAKGAEATSVPVLKIEAENLPANFASKLNSFLEGSPALLVSSANTFRFLKSNLGDHCDALKSLKLYVLGDAVKQQAEAMGFEVQWVAKRASAEDLVAEFLERGGSGKVLLPGSALRFI